MIHCMTRYGGHQCIASAPLFIERST